MIDKSVKLCVEAIDALPRIHKGDDIAALLQDALQQLAPLANGDVLVLAQKIISKAEGRTVSLASVKPSQRARELAQITAKDARFVELVLRESKSVVRTGANLLIVEHKLGFIHANAGIDHSNVSEEDSVLLLPKDPSASARLIAKSLSKSSNVELPVIINDSSGRPWRKGVVGMAIGCAGVQSLWDRRGALDLDSRPLNITEVGAADELATMASWLMGQGDEGLPAVLIRGALLGVRAKARIPLEDTGGMAPVLRSADEDLFR